MGSILDDNNVVIAVVKNWVASIGAYFYEFDKQALVHHRRKWTDNGDDDVKEDTGSKMALVF